MPTVTKLTKQQVENIQIDEGLVFIDYGLDTERKLAPTRGGGTFKASVSIRNIEFDGRSGATKGTQVIENQDAELDVVSLCMSQEELLLAMPYAEVETDEGGGSKVIKNPKCGVIKDDAYCANITMFAKLLSGKFKKITIFNPMSENGLDIKAAPKAEGEVSLAIKAHYTIDDLNGDLWKVEDIANVTEKAEAAAAAATSEEPAESTDN